VSSAAEEQPAREGRLQRAREQGMRAAVWAEERLPGATYGRQALERERMSAAGLLAGGLAYKLFFWLVPLGLVFAAVLSFWVESSPSSLEDAAREYGIGGAAASSAMGAIEHEAHARWYFLVVGGGLLFWFGIGVVRALNVAHAVAWRMRPEKIRRPLHAGALFTGLTIVAICVTAATGWLREQSPGPGFLVTLGLVVLYLAVLVWMLVLLPHRASSWPELLPGAALIAVGIELMHVAVVYYIAPKLGRSSELYGALGSATVILLWLYLVARLIVAAAFLNASIWEHRHGEAS
jgi:uncharacterized BrkB/YihY/UPF0761 family membrane protein